ncbi:prophage endopeptidase tail family protein [Bacillus swezeyi]|uniref:Tail spike domain-containing protein n=1 Tax=Bacillus swezeyi TaxID=1925020 RepID=A0A5M8RVU0_9BACI|nr:prophage endopeptidase tail family protein [Bacillus swezeyi]KAA6450944.1 hypothetical protein DX927_08920 [Bacillus swezeyi]
MADMWVFDNRDKKLAILSSDAEEACRFYDAPFREELNIGSSFSFIADATHEDSQYIVEENQVVFEDLKGRKRLFVIKELEDVDTGDNSEIRAICEPAMAELYEEFVTDIRPQNKTAQYAIDRVLEGTRWRGVVTVELGLRSTNFYRIRATAALNQILDVWGGEFYDEVVFSEEDDRIIDRIIHILPRRGKDTGKRFEIDKDIQEIRRTVISYPATALYGYGASLETEGGGNTRYIDFSDVEWSVANGDPVDKPKGQEWVGDPELLEKYGRVQGDGLRHRFKKWQDDSIEDTEELLRKTYEALINTESKVQVNYALKVELLQRIAGYEHEEVDLGDTTIALDRKFSRPIELQSRVIVFEYDISDPDNTAQVEMGQFLKFDSTEDRIKEIETTIDNNRGKWDSGSEVTDGSFPDKKPPTPQNVEVQGLFSKAYLSWDYDPSSYIAEYRVYGSQVKGFTPSDATHLWSGRMGGFVHEADVNQVWYYRIQAVNTHGTASDFTAEFSATTSRIGTNHIERQSITNALIKDLSADKITAGTINGITIRGSLIQGGRLEPISSSPQYESYIEANTIFQKRNFDLTVDTYHQFESLTINNGRIVQETGTQNYSNPDMNRVNNRTKIEYGKISLDGGKEFSSNSHVSRMQLYAQNSDSLKDIDPLSAIDIYYDDQLSMSLKNGSHGEYSKMLTSWDNPGCDLAINVGNSMTFDIGKDLTYTVGEDISITGGGRFEIMNPGSFSIDSDDYIYIGSGSWINIGGDLKLPSNFKVRGGGATDNTNQGRYAGMGLSLSYAINNTGADLTSNGLIHLDMITVYISTGSSGYGSTQYTFGDQFFGKAEKIYTVLAQPQGAYSNACTAGVENISNTGFKVYCRGTGTTTGVGDRNMKIFLCIFYKAAK